MSVLMLNPPSANPAARERAKAVMTKAREIASRTGASMGSALKEAWRKVRGNPDELMPLYLSAMANPLLDNKGREKGVIYPSDLMRFAQKRVERSKDPMWRKKKKGRAISKKVTEILGDSKSRRKEFRILAKGSGVTQEQARKVLAEFIEKLPRLKDKEGKRKPGIKSLFGGQRVLSPEQTKALSDRIKKLRVVGVAEERLFLPMVISKAKEERGEFPYSGMEFREKISGLKKAAAIKKLKKYGVKELEKYNYDPKEWGEKFAKDFPEIGLEGGAKLYLNPIADNPPTIPQYAGAAVAGGLVYGVGVASEKYLAKTLYDIISKAKKDLVKPKTAGFLAFLSGSIPTALVVTNYAKGVPAGSMVKPYADPVIVRNGAWAGVGLGVVQYLWSLKEMKAGAQRSGRPLPKGEITAEMAATGSGKRVSEEVKAGQEVSYGTESPAMQDYLTIDESGRVSDMLTMDERGRISDYLTVDNQGQVQDVSDESEDNEGMVGEDTEDEDISLLEYGRQSSPLWNR